MRTVVAGDASRRSNERSEQSQARPLQRPPSRRGRRSAHLARQPIVVFVLLGRQRSPKFPMLSSRAGRYHPERDQLRAHRRSPKACLAKVRSAQRAFKMRRRQGRRQRAVCRHFPKLAAQETPSRGQRADSGPRPERRPPSLEGTIRHRSLGRVRVAARGSRLAARGSLGGRTESTRGPPPPGFRSGPTDCNADSPSLSGSGPLSHLMTSS